MLTSLARVIGFFTMSAGAAGAVLLGAGFCWFVLTIPAEEVTLDRKADGIVALTGAAARIPDAIELLAAERGKRLLISCLLYTSDAADEEDSVDLGGRRI